MIYILYICKFQIAKVINGQKKWNGFFYFDSILVLIKIFIKTNPMLFNQ